MKAVVNVEDLRAYSLLGNMSPSYTSLNASLLENTSSWNGINETVVALRFCFYSLKVIFFYCSVALWWG